MSERASAAPRAFVREVTDNGPIATELRRLGWEVRSGAGPLDEVLTARPDLWVVELDAVTSEPFLFLQALARLHTSVPLLLLTHRDQLHLHGDRLSALQKEWPGRVDVLTAPYDKEELRLRVSWLLLSRDGKSVGGRVYEVGALRLDVDRHVVTFDSRAARLTPAEFRILATLLEASGGVVAKEELNRSIHRDGEGAAVSTIDGHVSRLRRKLAVLGMDARGISSVHGVGYRLEAEHLDPLSRI